MDYWIIAPAALAVAFVVSAIDFWVYIVFWRGLIGLAVAGGLLAWLGLSGPWLLMASLASGFVALALIEAIERMTKVALSVRSR